MSSVVFAGGGMKEVTPVVEPVVAVPMVEEHNGYYAGLALSGNAARNADISVDWGGTAAQDRVWNISVLAGYDFNEYIAVEGRYATSFAHEDVVEMDAWSLFVKPQYPVSEDFTVYALLGYGGVILEGINGVPIDVDDSNFQWGLGTSYQAWQDISIFVDYTFLANDMDGFHYNNAVEADVDTISVGVNYQF